jgi:hypothetical protein
MNTASDDQDPIRARRPRIPRAGSFVLFALLLLLAGLALTVWFPAHRQKRAVEALVHNSGYVVYAPGFEITEYNTGRPEGAEWLWKIIDPNLLYNVTTVRFYGEWNPQLGGDVLMPIVGEFTSVETVAIHGIKLTTNDVNHLRELPRLRQLYLEQTDLKDADLDALRGLKLEWLCLGRTWADDESLRSLSDMTSLEYLDLTRTRVTDAGLVHLESLTNLRQAAGLRRLVGAAGAALTAQRRQCRDEARLPQLLRGRICRRTDFNKRVSAADCLFSADAALFGLPMHGRRCFVNSLDISSSRVCNG